MLRRLFAVVALVVTAGTASAQKAPDVDLKPDGKTADHTKKEKVLTPDSWVEGQPKKEVMWYAGRQYDVDTAHAKAVLKDLKKYFPDYKDQGDEVAGFVWW